MSGCPSGFSVAAETAIGWSLVDDRWLSGRGCRKRIDGGAMVGATEVRVLSLAVASQVDLALERPSAEFASERLEARVLARVRYQVAALREGLAAHLALVWFFP